MKHYRTIRKEVKDLPLLDKLGYYRHMGQVWGPDPALRVAKDLGRDGAEIQQRAQDTLADAAKAGDADFVERFSEAMRVAADHPDERGWRILKAYQLAAYKAHPSLPSWPVFRGMFTEVLDGRGLYGEGDDEFERALRRGCTELGLHFQGSKRGRKPKLGH